jgi:thiosulfate reductase cytochrome b subunit
MKKLISITLTAVLSFIILAGLSFLMDKMMGVSKLTFLEFLEARWYYFAAIIAVFLIYTNYKGKNLEK